MKVATKFALAFVASGVLGVLVYSGVAASREVGRMERMVAEDLATLGRTLSASVVAVRQREGDARARELASFHDRDEVIRVRWTWLDVDPADPSAPRGGARVISPLSRGEPQTWIDATTNNERTAYAYAPLLEAAARPAALELSRPLVKSSRVFWTEIRAQLVMSALVVSLATALAVGLSSWIISRPLGRLAERARRIGMGDLSRELPVRGSDEVSALAEELNAMCDSLKEARNLAMAGARQRVSALEQLRHADRLRTVGTLASGIAHELGTPLNVISMHAKAIATGEVPPEEAPESARIILTQTDRVTKIVRQLLDFARRRSPRRAEVDVGELVDRVTQLLGALANKSRVEVKLGELARVTAKVDPDQIEQALTNLVINAIQAMPGGGEIRIAVREETAAPDRAPERLQRCAVVEVADSGVGIAPEHLERIFEPFFTTKVVGEGTGLGLSVTHGIAEDHGGWMQASSVVGEGTRLALYLPVDAGS